MSDLPPKKRAPRNRTCTCTPDEVAAARAELLRLPAALPTSVEALTDQIIWGDFFQVAPHIPHKIAALAVVDPPYNLTKNYHGKIFHQRDAQAYQMWFERMMDVMIPVLKPDATVYVCSDWRTSMLISPILERFFFVQNRIAWEREKGRGAQGNWKNNTEDIWFCTLRGTYYFDVEAVKMKRRVLAPYRGKAGEPKDWQSGENGKNFRLTHPSNFWSDITVPFWSMPENTEHPTQKPEKLIAKLLLASSRPGDLIFDPFLGSGTTAVVAKKLGRHFLGVEQNDLYCALAKKRLRAAAQDTSIQGYQDGVFWERNSRPGP